MSLKEDILKYALQNAVKFDGKANPGAVIGKILSENPELKKDMKNISKQANKIISEVNSMPLEEQKKQFEKYKGKIKIKKKKIKHGLPELKNAGSKVVMRFAPSPSGPMHLGHAVAMTPSSEYCRKYDGELILRIEDTNPDNIYEPAYKLLEEDAKWVTMNNISKVVIQSDRIGYYYDYAEKLIDMGQAYVCECNPDEFRKLIFRKKACKCRELGVEEHRKRYAKMFAEYKPGEAVLRMKTDINHKNPAMRDFPLMRINNHIHPRQGDKYKVWPLMNLAVFVDDVELGMTHILRAKDHMDNAKRQEFLYKAFNKKIPETIFIGKINFTGLPMSCSKVKVLIEEGKYSGWDDIRLPFLRALKRRGYQPEAFIKYSLDAGITQNDKTVSGDEFYKQLNFFNKEVIEAKANRYFFVPNPKGIVIKGAEEKEVVLDLHPDYPKRGHRKFMVGKQFYLAADDLKRLKEGKLYRLMDCLNFTKTDKGFEFDSEDYETYKLKGEMIMHWLPVKYDLVNIEVRMPNNKIVKGYGEHGLNNLKQGAIVQLERFGFARLDKKEKNKLIFWFCHR